MPVPWTYQDEQGCQDSKDHESRPCPELLGYLARRPRHKPERSGYRQARHEPGERRGTPGERGHGWSRALSASMVAGPIPLT